MNKLLALLKCFFTSAQILIPLYRLCCAGLSNAGMIEAKMRSLRMELSARLREMKKPSGSEGKRKFQWRFMDQLSFLKESTVPRGNMSNLTLIEVCCTLTLERRG